MVIIQPENKTLLVKNIAGLPVNLDTAGDVVRSNVTQPFNGEYFVRFVNENQVVVDDGSTISAPETVTRDGSTYNNNIGSSGLDIVFQTISSRNNEVQVSVSNTVNGQDTYLNRLTIIRNFGTCTNLDAINSNPRSKVILIKFEIPSVVKRVVRIEDVTAFFYKTTASGTSRNLEMFVIAPGNDGWIQGVECDSTAGAEPSWRAKEDDPTVLWAGTSGLRTAGTDYEDVLLSNPQLGSVNQWISFTDNSNKFIEYAIRFLRGDNIGFKIQTEDNDSNGITMKVASSEYTTDISRRPKIVVAYDEDDTLDAIVSTNYPQTLGTEDTFGGS